MNRDNSKKQFFDVLLMTATDEEFHPIEEFIQPDADERGWQEITDNRNFPMIWGTFKRSPSETFTVLVSYCKKYGEMSIFERVTELSTEFVFDCLAMSGICAGDPDKLRKGDLVVAEEIWGFGAGKVAVEYDARNQRHASNQRDLQNEDMNKYLSWPHHCAREWKQFKVAFEQQLRKVYPSNVIADTKLLYGIMQTVKDVTRDKKAFDEARQFKHGTIALEMEGLAIAKAANALKLRYCLLVKGVLDNATRKKDDRYKLCASYASALFILSFLGKHLPVKRKQSGDAETTKVIRHPGDGDDSEARKFDSPSTVINDPFRFNSGDELSYTKHRTIRRHTENSSALESHWRYIFRKELSTETSSGRSYLAEEIVNGGTGSQVKRFVKTPRIPLAAHHELKDKIIEETRRSFNEAFDNRGAIDKLNLTTTVAANILHIVKADVLFNGREYEIPCLVHEYIEHPDLETYFAKQHSGQGGFTGIKEPKRWFDLTEKIIEIVRNFHNHQIIHGELEPKNILLPVNSDSYHPIIVDFGKAFQLSEKEVGRSHLSCNSVYVAPERRSESDTWYTPADIYSIGGILFYLATGTPPPDIAASPTINRSDEQWFRDILRNSDEWKDLIYTRFISNRHLAEKNEGIVKVIDKCLRPRPEDRYSSAEECLQGLRAVNYQAQRTSSDRGSIKTSLDNVSLQWKELDAAEGVKLEDEVFSVVVKDRIDILQKELLDVKAGHLEIVGDREAILNSLVKYIGVLKPRDSYVTVTVPAYWTPDNLGINGRFLTVNKDLAKNGVDVNRLFLVSEDDLKDSRARSILAAHLKAFDDLPGNLRKTAPAFVQSGSGIEITGDKSGGMYVGVSLRPSWAVKECLSKLHNVALWRRSETGKMMSITFVLQPTYAVDSLQQIGSRIVKVRFRSLDEIESYVRLEREFNQKGNFKPIPLSTFCKSHKIKHK